MSTDLFFLALALMTWGIGEGMFYFFQPLYLQELGADPVKIGVIPGIVGISMGIAHLPAGYLADRFGRRPLLITAWILGTVSTGIMALSTSLPFFVIGMSLYGVTAFVSGPMNSYITAARGRWSVTRSLTLVSASFNVGAILGPLLGGWIGQHLGLHSSFGFAFGIFLLSTIFICFIRPQPVETEHHDHPLASLGKLLSPQYLRFLLLVFVMFFVIFLPQPLAQNYLQNQRGLSLEDIGLLISMRSLGVVLLNLSIGFLDARAGLVATQIGMALFSVVMWQGRGMPAFVLAYGLLGSTQTARLMLMAQGRALVKAENMGLAYGALETTLALVSILAPPLAGAVYAIQPDLVFPLSAAGVCLAIGLGLAFLPRPQPAG